MEDKSHKTAIYRAKPSNPTKYLANSGLINYPALDYGSGHGKDADVYNLDKYDPHYYPQKPQKEYKTVVCNYVLNVLDKDKAPEVFKGIKDVLTNDGIAYITVRRDIKEPIKTKIGTLQRPVYLGLKTVKKTKDFEMYSMTKEDEPEEVDNGD